MMKNGARPLTPDKRDYSFHHSFGSVGFDTATLPDSFLVDPGFTMPDQDALNTMFIPNVPPMPEGCTDYGTSEVCIDQDGRLYNPQGTENLTHANASGGGDIRASLMTAVNTGVEDAAGIMGNKRAALFSVKPAGALDWFDAMRTAVWINQQEKRSCSVGSIWYPDWEESVGANGVLPMPQQIVLNGPWHNYKIDGWVTFNGIPYLRVKSWQGPSYGDHGWAYMSREVCNVIMSMPGACAFTVSMIAPPRIVDFTFVSQFVAWFLGLFNSQTV